MASSSWCIDKDTRDPQNLVISRSVTGAGPGPVKWREPRQLTAAGQSLTLTTECQPPTGPAPDQPGRHCRVLYIAPSMAAVHV